MGEDASNGILQHVHVTARSLGGNQSAHYDSAQLGWVCHGAGMGVAVYLHWIVHSPVM